MTETNWSKPPARQSIICFLIPNLFLSFCSAGLADHGVSKARHTGAKGIYTHAGGAEVAHAKTGGTEAVHA